MLYARLLLAMNARDLTFASHQAQEPAVARAPRQQYTLAEKLAIVRESQQPGISQASISRKYRLGKNVLWGWRKSLATVPSGLLQEGSSASPDLQTLRDRIAELERLLGQKTFEIELLRSRLQGTHLGAPTVVQSD